jgi:hypothetical protein
MNPMLGLRQFWFLVNSNFELPKSKDKDEDEDTSSSTEPDPNMKHKGMELSLRGEPINFNSPL